MLKHCLKQSPSILRVSRPWLSRETRRCFLIAIRTCDLTSVARMTPCPSLQEDIWCVFARKAVDAGWLERLNGIAKSTLTCMAKFFLALITVAVAVLIAVFVFAAFTAIGRSWWSSNPARPRLPQLSRLALNVTI